MSGAPQLARCAHVAASVEASSAQPAGNPLYGRQRIGFIACCWTPAKQTALLNLGGFVAPSIKEARDRAGIGIPYHHRVVLPRETGDAPSVNPGFARLRRRLGVRAGRRAQGAGLRRIERALPGSRSLRVIAPLADIAASRPQRPLHPARAIPREQAPGAVNAQLCSGGRRQRPPCQRPRLRSSHAIRCSCGVSTYSCMICTASSVSIVWMNASPSISRPACRCTSEPS